MGRLFSIEGGAFSGGYKDYNLGIDAVAIGPKSLDRSGDRFFIRDKSSHLLSPWTSPIHRIRGQVPGAMPREW